MTILDYLHPHAPQAPVVAEPGIEETVAPPVTTTETEFAPVEPIADAPKEVEATPAPEDVAATTTVEPLKDDVNKQPTTTHAEGGNLHTEEEPATTVDGTPADKPAEEAAPAEETPAEVKEDKKEEKKAAVKDKVEKTKAEGKGFFAKLFGGNKSPKSKKVKTPKTAKADPTPVAPAAEAAVPEPVETRDAPEPIVEAAPVPAPVEPLIEQKKEEEEKAAAPVLAAPVEPVAETSTSVPPAPAPVEPEPAQETETVAAVPVETAEVPAETKPAEDAPVTPSKDPKAIKATRRLSTRFQSFVKNIGKKDQSPREEKSKEAAELKGEAEACPVAVADEAPKLDEPKPSEPLKIDDEKTAAAAPPPVAPFVAASA